MAKSHLKLVTPTGEIPTVDTPYRTREHLTEAEIERLIEATTSHRDAKNCTGYRSCARISLQAQFLS
jgi:hypothetical protein